MHSALTEPLLDEDEKEEDLIPSADPNRPIPRTNGGGWTSAIFIIGVEIAERFAYSGISSNLISYLTGPLGESTATAAANVNAWSGMASLLPLLGAFVADSWLGRYRTIVVASLLYILGLGLLTISSVIPSNGQLKVAYFFCSLYLVALAQGGHKPCVQAFGADQFDSRDPEECKSKSSFFNWWYFGLCGGTVASVSIVNYIEENINWTLGFGVPCVSMMFALLIFLLGTRTYRHSVLEDKGSFVRISQVIVASMRRRQDGNTYVEGGGAKISDEQVEEAKGVLRLFPIWATCLIYAIVLAQSSTIFVKQGVTMDRLIGRDFEVPSSALQSFVFISIVAFIPIYDRILVPITRNFTGIHSGLTLLQRIGIGMVLSMISMIVAALVEMKRLDTAKEFGLIDKPNLTIPMRLWWLVPQYVLFGISNVFTMVGLQEFFYDQVPGGLRSLGLALYLSIFGMGDFISSFLVLLIDRTTSRGGESWFSNNPNRAHLDYFYWLLAGLSATELPFLDEEEEDQEDLIPSDDPNRPISPTNGGGWTSAIFIIGVEIAERFAYYGISSNLISYLTGPLGESTATAAANVNAWSGVASLLPLIGAFVADSCLGRYRTIVVASLLYILGLGLLTISSVIPSNGQLKVAFFFFSLYLVALAQGGHKPCVQAFGADQFDSRDPEECKSKSSFFNWWYFGVCGGTVASVSIVNYIQENINWTLGFGVPSVSMIFALVIFLLGTRTYRHSVLEDKGPFVRISQVIVASMRRQQEGFTLMAETETKISEEQVEEAKGVLRLFPIWATCLIYAVVFAQSSTFFVKQGVTMDRFIGHDFEVPSSVLQSFVSISIIAFIPIYDRILVPIARKFTGIHSGLTLLQRIGIGMVLSVISMIVAALVEIKRLDTAKEFGLIDKPNLTIPMRLWWLVPQYVLFGISDVFTMVGLQEFFYDQVPDGLRSLGLALYLSILGVGNFISSFLVLLIDRITSRAGENWFSDNLNRAHLDYFYWLLVGLSVAELVIYIYFANSYIYKKVIALV
ncbi:putative peptide/nitrate transporter [Acorus calamus]|uniref:Peptide/nitrate transporter n=1 Tax=Acorus calamus TaxID=4465 RepID=A0AAV9DFS7_ACOCL|nr:putative peptide/nitrate transporter [Acorus calamus]